MAEESKEITLVVASCVEKTWGDGSKSFVIDCTENGEKKEYYSPDDLGTGNVKVIWKGKKSVYKIKAGGGGGAGGFQQKARDYTIENRQRALDAVIHHAQGKGNFHDLCTHAARVAEFYAKGTIPPKPEA